jgi:ABC-2 type transport system permease protein
MVDLKRPLLNWENETVAVKQNINSMFQMLIDWGLTIVLIIIGVLLLFVKLPAVIVSLLLTLILGGSCVIIYKLLKNKGLKVFDKIG